MAAPVEADPAGLAVPDTPRFELPPLPADPLAGPRSLDPNALVRGEEAAYQLYMEANRRLEAGELEAAEQTFAEALRTLPDERPYGRSRGSLALGWVRCHVALFERSGELAVLDREVLLLQAYVERLDQIATSPKDRAHKQGLVEQRLEEIEAARRLRAAAEADVETTLHGEHAGYRASTWRPDSLQDLGWYPRPDDPRKRAVQAVESGSGPEARADDQSLERARRPGVGLVVGGALSLATGAAGLSVMAVGMARAAKANDFDPMQSPMERREQIVTGFEANTMSTVGAIAGGALLTAGIILTTVGAMRMKKHRDSERPARVTLGPWGLRGRF